MEPEQLIVEKFEYFDMDDSKYSWYFDAEMFDGAFPLVYSYKSDEKFVNSDVGRMYDYLNAFSEYCRSIPDLGIFIVERKEPNVFVRNPITWPSDSRYAGQEVDPIVMTSGLVADFYQDVRGRCFMFSVFDKFNGCYYYRFVMGARVSNLEKDLKSKYFSVGSSAEVYSLCNWGFPYLQTILTRDIDVLKRYFFFMVRNHTYGRARFSHTLDNDTYLLGKYPSLMSPDVLGEYLVGFPADARGGNYDTDKSYTVFFTEFLDSAGKEIRRPES